MPHDKQIKRMRELGACPSFLVLYVYYWGHATRDEMFGAAKVQLVDGDDGVAEKNSHPPDHLYGRPVSPPGTLDRIRVAVARDWCKEPGTILAPQ